MHRAGGFMGSYWAPWVLRKVSCNNLRLSLFFMGFKGIGGKFLRLGQVQSAFLVCPALGFLRLENREAGYVR